MSKIRNIFLFLSLIFMVGCGGGGPSPSITEIQVSQLAFGQRSTITIYGSSLDSSILLTAEGCASLTPIASSQTTTSQTWTCVISKAGLGALSLQSKTVNGTVLKSQAFDIAAPTKPVVAVIEAQKLMYLKPTQFTITGYLLDKNVTVSTKNCSGLTLETGGSSTQQSISCTVTATGPGAVSLEISTAERTVIKSQAFDVAAPQVTMVTNIGTVVIEIDPISTPITSNNFLQYVNDKFYDNTIFHRIVKSNIFVAQGGWLTPTPSIQAGQRSPIALEVGKGLNNLKGTIAMARSTEPNSATSQFFFNLSNNIELDSASGGYAVFGKIVSGSSLLDSLSAISTSTQYGLNDFPIQSVIVKSIYQSQ